MRFLLFFCQTNRELELGSKRCNRQLEGDSDQGYDEGVPKGRYTIENYEKLLRTNKVRFDDNRLL